MRCIFVPYCHRLLQWLISLASWAVSICAIRSWRLSSISSPKHFFLIYFCVINLQQCTKFSSVWCWGEEITRPINQCHDCLKSLIKFYGFLWFLNHALPTTQIKATCVKKALISGAHITTNAAAAVAIKKKGAIWNASSQRES